MTVVRCTTLFKKVGFCLSKMITTSSDNDSLNTKKSHTIVACFLAIAFLSSIVFFNSSGSELTWKQKDTTACITTTSSSSSEEGCTTNRKHQCLSFDNEFDRILASSKQVFLTMPTKAAGSSMGAFLQKHCLKDYYYPVSDLGDFAPSNPLLGTGPSFATMLDFNYDVPPVLSSHIGSPDDLPRLVRSATDETLVIYMHRQETDRLISSIKHVASSFCSGLFKNINNPLQHQLWYMEKYGSMVHLVDEDINGLDSLLADPDVKAIFQHPKIMAERDKMNPDQVDKVLEELIHDPKLGSAVVKLKSRMDIPYPYPAHYGKCIIEESVLHDIVSNHFNETFFSTKRTLTCGFFDELERHKPQNMVLINYKQANKLQLAFAQHYCPELITRNEVPIQENVDAMKDRVYTRLANSKTKHGLNEVLLTEWVETKRHVLETVFDWNSDFECHGKVRELEKELFPCNDEILHINV